MSFDNEKMGLRIKQYRNLKNISQEELADLVFTTRESINRIENGNRTPNLMALVEIANALGISVDDILIDSLDHTSSLVNSELYLLLSDIPEKQREILTKLIKDIKNALDELKI